MLLVNLMAENLIPSLVLFVLAGLGVRPIVGARLPVGWVLVGVVTTIFIAAFVRLALSIFSIGDGWSDPTMDGGLYNLILVAVTAFLVHHIMAASVGVPVETVQKGEEGPWV